MAKGFGGMPGGMQEIMKQAQKMQEKMLKIQEESKSMTAEATSGGGMVKAVANGNNQITELKIDKQVVNADDVDMLQDMVVAAINSALQKAQEAVKAEMAKITGGMNLPGMF